MTKTALRLLLAMMMLVPGAVLGASPVAAQQPPSGDSAVTVSGEGEFSNLKVTVSQTKNLINQTVKITWTGGTPTPSPPDRSFLQIMQCWGDDLHGPDRTQCQFGATQGSASGTAGRVISVPNPLNSLAIVDPAEPLKAADPRGFQASHVPFWPVGGTKPTEATLEDSNEFFDSQVTNELPLVRTRPDGTGEVDFEIETVRQAAGLGCGDPLGGNGTTTSRSCWLVIVPRGSTEVNGSTPDFHGLQSSPLSQTNWAKKIAIRLGFLPQGRPCPLGAPERRLFGHELAVDAVSRWQPALCANGGTLYNYTQLSDDLVRDQLLAGSDPGMALMSNPVPPDAQPDHPLVYAPIAVSGLAFVFNIVASPSGLLKPDDPKQQRAGQRFTEMKLTPRLVAKLLTQSYRGAIAGQGAAVPETPGFPAQPARLQKNPFGLTNDPEFLDLNPEYRDLVLANGYTDALVQLGTSDLTGLLWDWVLADPDARKFIDGTPDSSGMVVNEANKGLRPPLYSYPRNDQGCIPVAANNTFAPFCTGDAHQFANDMHEAGRSAYRGDPLARNPGSPTVRTDGTVSFGKAPRQLDTDQRLMAVVDVATAQRYGLPTAKLRNSAREFVAPDAAGLRAGLDAMKPSAVRGVLAPDPVSTNAAAYPLTAVSNAVTAPSTLTEEAGRLYAAFIRYAVGTGQQPGQLPGQLPAGYLPLPEPLRQQALATAVIIETQAGKAPGGDAPPDDQPNGGAPGNGNGTGEGPGTGSASDSGTGSVSDSATGQASVPPPGPAPVGVVPVGAQANNPTGLTPAVRRTLALAAWAVGTLLVALLVAGGLAVVFAVVAHRLGESDPDSEGGDASWRTVARRYLSWPTARSTFLARRR